MSSLAMLSVVWRDVYVSVVNVVLDREALLRSTSSSGCITFPPSLPLQKPKETKLTNPMPNPNSDHTLN